MTPQGMLGAPTATTPANTNLYNQVSSAGVSTPEQSQQQPQMESLVEKATKRFGAVFQQFVALTESYPGADKEAQAVKDAMANWHLRVANMINESGQNSIY